MADFIVFAGGMPSKPLPPVLISIVAVNPSQIPENIGPGEIVELTVTMQAFTDQPSTTMHIILSEGAELVSEESGWTGSLAKDEVKTFIISVRTSKEGKGKIVARMAAGDDKKTGLRSEARYQLGKSAKKKSRSAEPKSILNKGREVVEYEVK
ncbi:MAG TPA: hypothetical protein VN604_06790 [Nitrospirota bacterium]|nr:hypothetical protein [Nitrospirota bacterium]